VPCRDRSQSQLVPFSSTDASRFTAPVYRPVAVTCVVLARERIVGEGLHLVGDVQDGPGRSVDDVAELADAVLGVPGREGDLVRPDGRGAPRGWLSARSICGRCSASKPTAMPR
jgi:hypothetical protein